MKTKHVILFGSFLLLTLSFNNAQTLKKISRNPYPNFKEEFFVLKDKPEIKEGPYRLSINGIVYQIGSFKNNQKVGVWQIFKSKNVLDFKYNYDTNQLIYLNEDNFLNPKDSTSYGPIFLGGLNYLLYSVANTIDIPDEIKKTTPSGRYRVLVRFLVDSLGNVKNYEILTSSNNLKLDKLAISSVMQATNLGFSFLPATDKGKPISLPMILPITLSLENK